MTSLATAIALLLLIAIPALIATDIRHGGLTAWEERDHA